jgi:hypothetical protein
MKPSRCTIIKFWEILVNFCLSLLSLFFLHSLSKWFLSFLMHKENQVEKTFLYLSSSPFIQNSGSQPHFKIPVQNLHCLALISRPHTGMIPKGRLVRVTYDIYVQCSERGVLLVLDRCFQMLLDVDGTVEMVTHELCGSSVWRKPGKVTGFID